MHIADGFISQPASIAASSLAAVTLGWALGNVQRNTTTDQWKIAPAVAATVFVAQMVNFAVGPVMSGHLLGGALAAILLGPALAMLVMAVVLSVQCAILGDGGITALGANFLSMGVVAVLVASGLQNWFKSRTSNWAATAVASWASVVAGSLVCSLAITGSGFALGMVGNHSLIGLAEAGITILMLGAVQSRSTLRSQMACLTAMAAILIAFVPFRSTLPDGMEAALTGSTGTGYFLFGAAAALPLLAFVAHALLGAKEGKRVRVCP
jgi:cobalt/nickel transport system permease protein